MTTVDRSCIKKAQLIDFVIISLYLKNRGDRRSLLGGSVEQEKCSLPFCGQWLTWKGGGKVERKMG